MADVHLTLIGGGWDPAYAADVYGPFLAAAAARTPEPRIACLVLDEHPDDRGSTFADDEFTRWATVLQTVARCRPLLVRAAMGRPFDADELPAADGVLVCGGLTPQYAKSLAPARAGVRAWLHGRPYAGFSAGAAVAAEDAIVGGWLVDGHPVCPVDAAEDLDEVTAMPGLGLVSVGIEVHAAQWETIDRAAAAVQSGLVPAAIALDENTALIVTAPGRGDVVGAGSVHQIAAGRTGPVITHFRAGEFVSF